MSALRQPICVFLALVAAGCSSAARRPRYETLPHNAVRDSLTAQRCNQRGLAAAEAGDLEQAAEFFRRALEADLWYGPAHSNLGVVLMKQGRLYPASLELDWAAKLMPHAPGPRNNLGLVLEKAGRLEEAIACYAESLELSPDNIEVLGHLARAYVKSDRKDTTVRELLQELAYRGDGGWDLWARQQLIRLDR